MTTQFFVRRGRREDVPSGYQVFEASSMLSTGESDFREAFGAVSTLESDLLLLAASVFAADRASQRGEREDFYRTIHVSVPITNISRLLPLRGAIEAVLRKLSDDGWTIELRSDGGAGERRRRMPKSRGRTLLFSGGLDSLAAAVEFSQLGQASTCQPSHAQQCRNQRAEAAGRAARWARPRRYSSPVLRVIAQRRSQRTPTCR